MFSQTFQTWLYCFNCSSAFWVFMVCLGVKAHVKTAVFTRGFIIRLGRHCNCYSLFMDHCCPGLFLQSSLGSASAASSSSQPPKAGRCRECLRCECCSYCSWRKRTDLISCLTALTKSCVPVALHWVSWGRLVLIAIGSDKIENYIHSDFWIDLTRFSFT